MAPPKKYHTERVGEIIRSYFLDGESQITLAQRHGTHRTHICRIIRSAGYEGRTPSEAAQLREKMGRGKCRTR